MLARAVDFEQRAATRHPVDYPALAERQRRGDIALRIVNVSAMGFMAIGDLPLAVGERLTLRLPAIGTIEAQLMWRNRVKAGFHFERLIRVDDFTRMFIAMQPGHPTEH
jgi:hypothetical protein